MAEQDRARECFFCKTPITACMGFTIAGDFVDFLEGRRKEIPRELCGICNEKLWPFLLAYGNQRREEALREAALAVRSQRNRWADKEVSENGKPIFLSILSAADDLEDRILARIDQPQEGSRKAPRPGFCTIDDCHKNREQRMVVVGETPSGKPIFCDPCLADLVKALNDAGLQTVASCCGHKRMPPNIVLADGREIIIARTWGEARKIDKLYPEGINPQEPGP